MKIVTILGARPQFIKAATVSRAIIEHNKSCRDKQIIEIILHTGQHYDQNMSDIFFEEMQIPRPDFFLNINGLTHGAMTGQMLEKIEQVLQKEQPDVVMVYGDTNSTLAGALAAVKLHIPVAHVEAGLRSFNKKMPEEINRILTDHVSRWLFCPTRTAVKNLYDEGINQGVSNTGDVMLDAFLFYRQIAEEKSTILQKLQLQNSDYALSTIHREENTNSKKKLVNIFAAFNQIANDMMPIILPLHPRTSKYIKNNSVNIKLSPYIKIIDPVGYFDMVLLEAEAKIILTDSGGVQKEAFFAGVPCITLRDETEWIETVEAGWNIITGSNVASIIDAFSLSLKNKPAKNDHLFGDGKASHKIVKELSQTI